MKNKAKPAKKTAAAATATAVLVALSALPAQHAAAQNAPLTVEAVLVPTGQAILATQNLNFGDVVQGGAGTVSVNTAGAPTYGGGASSAGGTIQQGIIRAFAATGVVVTYNVTDPTITITDGGTGDMLVNNFNIGTNAGGTAQVIPMTGTTMPIPIGGTLNVGGADPVGTYTGSVTVNAVFN